MHQYQHAIIYTTAHDALMHQYQLPMPDGAVRDEGGGGGAAAGAEAGAEAGIGAGADAGIESNKIACLAALQTLQESCSTCGFHQWALVR
jgi:hypothetical protein